MNIEVPSYFQALTADGDATGYAKVADTSGFYAGCLGFITGTTAASKRVIITEIKDSNYVGLRFIADDSEQQLQMQVYGGRSNLSAYTLADGAKLFMDRQLARVEPQMQSQKKPNV